MTASLALVNTSNWKNEDVKVTLKDGREAVIKPGHFIAGSPHGRAWFEDIAKVEFVTNPDESNESVDGNTPCDTTGLLSPSADKPFRMVNDGGNAFLAGSAKSVPDNAEDAPGPGEATSGTEGDTQDGGSDAGAEAQSDGSGGDSDSDADSADSEESDSTEQLSMSERMEQMINKDIPDFIESEAEINMNSLNSVQMLVDGGLLRAELYGGMISLRFYPNKDRNADNVGSSGC